MARLALRVQGLDVGYGRHQVIEGLSLDAIEPGQVVSVIGPNAAGKSTLLRALAGLLPAKGSVRLGAVELLELSLVEHASRVTYMPQTIPPGVALTVLEAVMSALRASPSSGAGERAVIDRALEVVERIGLRDLALVSLERLSGGQRQLASLAQALARSPRVVLLDEPISALDPYYQLRVLKLVRQLAEEQGMIAILVLHDLSIAARWSDRVVVLAGGKVAADAPPREAITASILAKVYRVSARIASDSVGLRVDIDDTLSSDSLER